MKYNVVLDSKNSYLVEADVGLTFKQSCDIIIEYCKDAGYMVQQAIWEVNRELGKQTDNIMLV
jgi:hypothetical protein